MKIRKENSFLAKKKKKKKSPELFSELFQYDGSFCQQTPVAGAWRWEMAIGKGRGGGSRVVPAPPRGRGHPPAPQQLGGERGSLPDFHPGCRVRHLPAGAGDGATPRTPQSDARSAAALLRSAPPRRPQPRGKPRRGEAAGGGAAPRPHHLQNRSPCAPPAAAPAQKVTSPRPEPHRRPPCSVPAAGRVAPPFPSHLFLPILFIFFFLGSH